MKLFLLACIALLGANSAEAAKVCRSFGDRVCAVDTKTGQCTHEWTSGDGAGDAMYQCQRWMNPNMGRVDRRNFTCSATSGGVCARDLRTGQCTHEWKRESGGGDPWFFCRQWLGR